jgi:bacteriocin-like protein
MTTPNPSEKDRRPATSSPADAEVEAPREIARELTEDELASVVGGTYQTTTWPATEKPVAISGLKF